VTSVSTGQRPASATIIVANLLSVVAVIWEIDG